MHAIELKRDQLDQLIEASGLSAVFGGGDIALVDCPGDEAHPQQSMRLNRRTGRFHCDHCGCHGGLADYLRELGHGLDIDVYSDVDDMARNNVVPLASALPTVRPPRQLQPEDEALAIAVQVQTEAETRAMMEAHFIAETKAQEEDARIRRRGRLGERVIMTLLALIFLGAGLAAAALSAYANFQAFSAGVADPTQGQVWGWSGVIASVCSFGGFTFFYWHMSAKRFSESARALLFALAGAATSIAGTSMFMSNNTLDQQAKVTHARFEVSVIEAQIDDWSRQIAGIPAETRSVDGLKSYLAGVEAVGRTHEKPYRDAQNELGLAERRAVLETKIGDARAQLLSGADVAMDTAPLKQGLPGWFFAIMLELFSSQGTSIAFVSLLLLYGASSSPVTRPGPGS